MRCLIGDEFKIPSYQTSGSAGLDLLACVDEELVLEANESTIIPSGISIFIEDSQYVRIEIRNFGVFESKPTKAKPRARNPRTNEEIYVPAHKKTRFKPGKILKEHLKRPI